MMTKAVITFFISLAIYLVVMGGISLGKYLYYKRKVKKEQEEYKKELENNNVENKGAEQNENN